MDYTVHGVAKSWTQLSDFRLLHWEARGWWPSDWASVDKSLVGQGVSRTTCGGLCCPLLVQEQQSLTLSCPLLRYSEACCLDSQDSGGRAGRGHLSMRAEAILGLPVAVGGTQADHLLHAGDWHGCIVNMHKWPGDLRGPDSVFLIKSSHAPLSPQLQDLSWVKIILRWSSRLRDKNHKQNVLYGKTLLKLKFFHW